MSKNKDLEAPLKIALVHDWLTNMRGGERVLLAMKEAFPDADIYTSVYNSQNLPEFDKYKDQIKTTWIQKFPKKLRNFHQLFPVIRVFAFKSLNLKDYDIIISDTSSDAKHARGGPKTKHICYCFTPTRFYWSHYNDYKKDPGFGKLNLLIKPIIPPFVWLMRKFDYSAAQKVNQFVAISSVIQKPSASLNYAVVIELRNITIEILQSSSHQRMLKTLSLTLKQRTVTVTSFLGPRSPTNAPI